MAFCTNCGSKLNSEAKFCSECGSPVSGDKSRRTTVYEGQIHKCPSCGEVLDSFVTNCPSCGYELRGNKAASSVRELYRELRGTAASAQKNYIIRNFPIPNSKEDIIEFMIMASSNILGENDSVIYEAWLAKFEQAYQKSVLMFKNDSDFDTIQRIYDDCRMNISSEKHRKIGKTAVDTIVRNIIVGAGLVLMIIAIIVDAMRENSTMFEMAAYFVLIACAVSLLFRRAKNIDYAVVALSGILIFVMSYLLDNGSVAQLSGAMVLIITAINFFINLARSNK